MVITDDVIKKIDKDNKLLGLFNDSKPNDFFPREVVIAFRPESDPIEAARLMARIDGLLDNDSIIKMKPENGSAVISNVRAEQMARVIGLDFVTAAGVGNHHRDRPDTEIDKGKF